MNFVEKLISDTQQGFLDDAWGYQDRNKYKFTKKKHILNGLNFVKGNKQLIFSNGFGLSISENQEDRLIKTINQAIINSGNEAMDIFIQEQDGNNITDNEKDTNETDSTNIEDNDADNKLEK